MKIDPVRASMNASLAEVAEAQSGYAKEPSKKEPIILQSTD